MIIVMAEASDIYDILERKDKIMKRLSFGLLIMAMLLSLVSCGNRSSEPLKTGSNGTSETSNGKAITDQTEETDETKETEETEIQDGDEIMESGEFNFETKTVTLNSGYEMPVMELGTYKINSFKGEETHGRKIGFDNRMG